jgi:hypothetical protein
LYLNTLLVEAAAPRSLLTRVIADYPGTLRAGLAAFLLLAMSSQTG